MLKVYLTPPQPSRGLQRIADALTRYLPAGWKVAEHVGGADLVVFYAIGRREKLLELTQAIAKSRFQRYAIIQVCLRSTMTPSTKDWRHIWHEAQMVWSYYDLNRAILDDDGACGLDNFYHAPLGVDSRRFEANSVMKDDPKWFIIATSGVSRLQESVRECLLAAETVNRPVFHLGDYAPSWKGNITFSNGVDDGMLATYYSACEFVSGLRRKEGFELPAAEGLLCGARPVLFDTPDYRWNYKHWGEYIQETDRQGVVDQLVELFKQGARPVTQEERDEAAEWFNWEKICRGFWERCL